MRFEGLPVVLGGVINEDVLRTLDETVESCNIGCGFVKGDSTISDGCQKISLHVEIPRRTPHTMECELFAGNMRVAMSRAYPGVKQFFSVLDIGSRQPAGCIADADRSRN